MLTQKTNEFSLCLEPATEITDTINKIRTHLAPSPYRDDPPHITLARGIVSNKHLTDVELVNKVNEATGISKKMPLSGLITDVVNKSNEFYSESAQLIISPSEELRSFRKNLLESLNANDFTDESQDKNEHDLHITIRLGVKLEGDIFAEVKRRLLDTPVVFSDWWLFRLELDNNARIMHKVAVSTQLRQF